MLENSTKCPLNSLGYFVSDTDNIADISPLVSAIQFTDAYSSYRLPGLYEVTWSNLKFILHGIVINHSTQQ